MVIINILDILKKYSDMDHRLTQAQIMDILKKEYYMDVDRRTVKRNLMNLLDFDFGIVYTEIIKKNEKGEDVPICTDWYITRDFDDSELSRKRIIRTCLKRHNFGIFWLVIFARRQPYCIFRTKICSKFYPFQVVEF